MSDDQKMGASFVHGLLPHRYPMLMVDAMKEVEPGRRGLGVKNVTSNEHYLQGHFPGEPIMPGVMAIECMAQVAGIVLASGASLAGGGATAAPKPAYLMSVDSFKFRKPIRPGDTLLVDVRVVRQFQNLAKVAGEIRVGDTLVASGELSLAGQ